MTVTIWTRFHFSTRRDAARSSLARERGRGDGFRFHASASARARDDGDDAATMSFRADAKFRERCGARDDVATRAREAREARKTERVRERAVVVCQSHRRAGLVRRERRMRARERLDDALARLTEEEKEEKEENDDSLSIVVDAVTREGVRGLGAERAFRAFAVSLKRIEEVSARFDATTLAALAESALATVRDAGARETLPALVVCVVKLVVRLRARAKDARAFVESVHASVCDAMAAAASAERSERGDAVMTMLAPLALEPLHFKTDGVSGTFQKCVGRLLRVPRLRKHAPREMLDDPATLIRLVRASSDPSTDDGRDAETVIENILDLMCRDGRRNEHVRSFVEADDAAATLALRALSGLSASARTTSKDWYKRFVLKVNTMNETWFLTSLIGDARGTITSPEKAADAASLFIELSRSNDDGTFSAAAFSSGYLHSLWTYLARALSLPQEVSNDQKYSSTWIASAFERNGALSLPAGAVDHFHFFFSAYAYLLVVLRDKKFFDEQSPFTLGEQRSIAVAVNTIVVRTHISSQTHSISVNLQRTVDAASALLHALTARDARRSFCSKNLWLAPNSMKLSPSVAASALQCQIDDGVHTQMTGLLNDCPQSISFDERVKIFRELIKADRKKAGYRPQAGGADASHRDSFIRPVANLVTRRESVLEDTMASILPLGSKARGRILVKFVNAAGQEEAGIDAGGLFKELLSVVTEQSMDPNRGLFTTNASGLVYPSPRAADTHEGILQLEMVGMMVGKGMYEGILQNINMAPFFAATILGTPRTIDDIPSLDEELARSIVQILEYDGEVSDLCLDFTCTEEVYGKILTKELVPGGSDVEVNDSNKLLYVHLLADYHLNRRIAAPMMAFMRGLTHIIDRRWLRLFNSKELSLLLSGGESAIDVEDWEKHTKYSGGYTASSTAVKNFWRTMRKFSPEQRQNVLKFVTSSPRPPLQGFKHLNPPFVIHRVRCEASVLALVGGADVKRLPSASTCFNMLKLPNYRRLSTLERSVAYAAESRAGFELS